MRCLGMGHCGCTKPAVYVWTCQPSGNQIPLCVDCCAGWRANAVDDPALGPESIRQLAAVR